MNPQFKSRFVLSLVRVLAWRNGLEGFMSLLGFVWGVSALSLPAYWTQPCAGSMHAWMLTPLSLGWVLIATGLLGWASLVIEWRYLRMQSSVVAFIVWGLMAVWSWQTPSIPVVDDVAVYSAFAAAELAIYVRILAGLDPASEVKSGALFKLDRRREETPTRSDDDAGDS